MATSVFLFKVQIWKAPAVGPDAVAADIVQRVQASTTYHAMVAAMRFHHLSFAHIVVVSPSSARQGFDSWYQVTCPPLPLEKAVHS